MVREIETTHQGFKGPNYEKLRTTFLTKERELIEDVLAPICSTWSGTRFSILLNVLRAEDCLGGINDSHLYQIV